MNTQFKEIEECRVCYKKNLMLIHSFGIVPVADKLMKNMDDHIDAAPLSLLMCLNCGHLQIKENLAPNLLFKHNYPYLSSKIPEVANHFKNVSKKVIKEQKVNKTTFILEIAGNDGVLLKHFKNIAGEMLNIEPSLSPASVSINENINTITDFFSKKLALNLLKNYKKPNVIYAANVLAHVPNPNDFVEGLAILTSNETKIIIEVPHALPMVKNNLFDVIFHQHYSYFHLHALIHLFKKYDLFINKIDLVDTQGGSLRLYISKNNIHEDDSVEEILKQEIDFDLLNIEKLKMFSNKIYELKHSLNRILSDIIRKNEKIVGYGASGKAATLLNFFEIKNPLLKYIVDISPSKQNKIFPFTELKIYPIGKLLESPPHYILILAWNYTESIISNLSQISELKNVKFITLYPSIKVIH